MSATFHCFIPWLKRATTLLICLSAATYLYCSYKVKQPIDSEDVLTQLQTDPIQTSTKAPGYRFEYADQVYRIEPLADYEITGMVVSTNDISSWFDMYHDSNSVDVKDICVVWGDNTIDNLYHHFDFWSEPWTCNAYTESRKVYEQFNPEQLSNNHILVADEEHRQAIMNVHRWDQIYMKGQLINYYPDGRKELSRRSSLRRNDQGNGACEVLFVQDFAVLSPAWETEHQIRFLCIISLALLLVLRLSLFLYTAYR